MLFRTLDRSHLFLCSPYIGSRICEGFFRSFASSIIIFTMSRKRILNIAVLPGQGLLLCCISFQTSAACFVVFTRSTETPGNPFITLSVFLLRLLLRFKASILLMITVITVYPLYARELYARLGV